MTDEDPNQVLAESLTRKGKFERSVKEGTVDADVRSEQRFKDRKKSQPTLGFQREAWQNGDLSPEKSEKGTLFAF